MYIYDIGDIGDIGNIFFFCILYNGQSWRLSPRKKYRVCVCCFIQINRLVTNLPMTPAALAIAFGACYTINSPAEFNSDDPILFRIDPELILFASSLLCGTIVGGCD